MSKVEWDYIKRLCLSVEAAQRPITLAGNDRISDFRQA